MKTSRIVLAATGLLLAGAMLTGVAATHTHGPGQSSYTILSEQLHNQLNLRPEQDRQWQTLKDEEDMLHSKMREYHRQLHDVADAEFAKPRPDLAAIAAAADSAHQRTYAARRDFRQHALAFYSDLSPEQQGVVIDTIKEKRQRMDRFFERRHHPKSGDR
ncbi:MAG: periplasmic heavy metal sensor [Burkholderiales bacterium]